MTTRAYVPIDLAGLRDWYAAGAVPADTERILAEADDEDAEYDALMTAADQAPDPRRRVVVVAETAGDAAIGALGVTDWVAVHCDPAERPVDADPEDDLAWFATQEIGDLIGD